MAVTLTKSLPGLLRPLTLLGRGGLSHDAVRAAQMSCRFSTVVQRQVVQRPLLTTPLQGLRSPQLRILHRISPLLPRLLLQQQQQQQQPTRSLTYYSLKKGKTKSVKSVTERFLRLHCGLWVRRKAGYKKKLWKKSAARKTRLRQHVFCSKTQCKKLDKMTTSFWKRRNWYLNDPYQKYHDRVNLV